jgi:Fe-S-cluster-containing hydrogenase component 2
MYAVRNSKLCTKDCLCLFVCPTGATDTETGQIDASKCLDGCRLCVDACPSHAISLMVTTFPKREETQSDISHSLKNLLHSKVAQIQQVSQDTSLLARALHHSLKILGEDCAREDGYMIAQDTKSIELLRSLLDCEDPKLPKEVIKKLLATLT